MKRGLLIIAITIGIVLFSYTIFNKNLPNDNNLAGTTTDSRDSKFNTLVWADEFEGEGMIDSNKWFHQTQLPPGGNWWGGLIQHYTDRETNTYLKDGYLHLVAKKEEYEDQGKIKQYTAARLNSKFAFTYGKVEVKAKLPTGTGTWPAIWMLNKNINEDGAYWDNKGFGTVNWPNCGEIDILEHWGKNQDYVSSAVHNGSSYGDIVKNLGGQNIKNASTEFHIYTLEWTKEKMIFSIDGVEHFQYNPSTKNIDTWPYDSDYYLLFNIAIEPDIDPEFTESSMIVDYIRVFK
ncbi:glycoside hydrolase family 16 protein [Flagellimonas pacifica]|uniref:Glycosyl hydrolases family 16 n=1 Tax=Flagellimonas pacifica TaxID=1247520 RepID=A0A285MV62_9FLAO|nr:glycoside hydrolase family 16 protein [Allomuricauda parva]SNZ01074.1 Glycosyl hydrolases family 16 [Allomuricauda parva]